MHRSFSAISVKSGRLGLLALVALALLALPKTVHGASAPSHVDRQILLKLINKSRKAHHVKPLTLSLKQSRCSTKHSWAMAARHAIFHGVPGDICITHQLVGENVGMASGRLLDGLGRINHAMWAEGPCPSVCLPGSPMWLLHGHYLNLVNPAFGRIGIGIVVHRGTTYLTEDFTN